MPTLPRAANGVCGLRRMFRRRPPLAKIKARRSHSTPLTLPSCPPINRDHAREHERKSEFCFEVGNETGNPPRRGHVPMKCWRVARAQVAKKPNRKSGCVNRPADALNIWHPTTDEPAIGPGPHGRGGFDRNGHGVCRIMVAVTMHMSSRRRPISLIRRSIINWTSASVMGFSVLAIKRRMELFSGRYFLDGRSRARGRRV